MAKDTQAIIKKEKARYAREWRKNNPERNRAINERYWLKKAEERKAQEGKGNAVAND